MNFEYEKDYIMRIIKEMVRILFSLLFGKKQVAVEQEAENKYEVAGKKLSELKAMKRSRRRCPFLSIPRRAGR